MVRRRKRKQPKPLDVPDEALLVLDEVDEAPRHRPWVGVVAAFLVPGAAHALAGQWRAGAAWFAAIHGSSLLGLWFFALPGDLCLGVGLLGFAATPVLWLVMLVKSYRPMHRLRLRVWIALCAVVLLTLLGLNLVFWPGIEGFSVPTATMAPTIEAGDNVIVSRFALQFSDPRRWDVVAFRHRSLSRSGAGEEEVYLRRVVGLPGEVIRLCEGSVEVDGELLPLPAALVRAGFRGYVGSGGLATPAQTITLGAQEYLLLADRSERSLDSRHFGAVSRGKIFGRATRIFEPLERVRTSLTGD